MPNHRPSGTTSRLRRAPGPRTAWAPPKGGPVELPVVLDLVNVDPASGERAWTVEATVDLVDFEPALVGVELFAPRGLDVQRLARFFRWETPLDVVTTMVPRLVSRGVDPFEFWYPVDGYPDAAQIEKSRSYRLTDAFLEEIATVYLRIGRGYAGAIASEFGVSPRTAVSWIEKARSRGILAGTERGKIGGRIISRSQRAQ